jgi:hypothetical protein
LRAETGDFGEDQVGDDLLVELIHLVDRELPVGPGDAVFRAEPEDRPGELIGGEQHPALFAGRLLALAHFIEPGRVEAGSRAPRLLGEVGRVALAGEILVPAHAAVRRGLPGL